MMVETKKTLLSTKDAAALLEVTDSRVRQLLIEGKLKGKRISGVWVIQRNDIERYQSQRRL